MVQASLRKHVCFLFQAVRSFGQLWSNSCVLLTCWLCNAPPIRDNLRRYIVAQRGVLRGMLGCWKTVPSGRLRAHSCFDGNSRVCLIGGSMKVCSATTARRELWIANHFGPHRKVYSWSLALHGAKVMVKVPFGNAHRWAAVVVSRL